VIFIGLPFSSANGLPSESLQCDDVVYQVVKLEHETHRRFLAFFLGGLGDLGLIFLVGFLRPQSSRCLSRRASTNNIRQ
jgi:hypothetical protein